MRGPARRLWTLVKNLPQESATFQAFGHTRTEEYLATLIDLTSAAHFEKPITVPRPSKALGSKKPQKHKASNVYSIAEFQKRHMNDPAVRKPTEGGE